MQQSVKFFVFTLYLVGCVLSESSLLSAQAPGQDTVRQDGLLQDLSRGPDTFDVSYFFIDNPLEVFSYSDTLLGNYFHLPQPSRHRDLDKINLGNVGTPQQALVFEPGFRYGFDVGFHQFDGYRMTSYELPFYKIKKSFTDAAFAQGRTQADQLLSIKFSRNFGEAVNFSIDYDRVNHAGVFKNQKSRNSAFATGFWYHHPNGIYDGYFTITHNSNFQGDNGGIDLSKVTPANQNTEETVPVMLESTVPPTRGTDPDAAAQTRYQSQEVAYAHYFRIRGPSPNRKKTKSKKQAPKPLPDSTIQLDSLFRDSLSTLSDSTQHSDSLRRDTSLLIDSLQMSDSLAVPAKIRKPWKREFLVFHKIRYENSWYKFSDVNLAADSSYYGEYQVHNQGLRYYIIARTLENTIRIGTSRKEETTKPKGRFEVGVLHRLIRLEQEPLEKSTVNNLFLTGHWDFSPTRQIHLRSYAHYGLWDNGGDYYISGDLRIDLGNLGEFSAKAIQQHYSPSLVQSRMYISDRLIWDKDHRKTFETTLAATYRLDRTGTEISGRYHLLNNYIYFDTLAQPQQTGVAISIPQVILKQDFQLGPFHLDNVLAWQLSSEEQFLPLPNLYGKHSLYVEGKIFRRVMLARFGVDLQWNSRYRPNTYQHLFGQFHLQTEQELGYYPMVDVFFSMKVKTLRAFVKGENVTWFFYPDNLIYQTPNYPIPYFLIRFGLSWRFLN